MSDEIKVGNFKAPRRPAPGAAAPEAGIEPGSIADLGEKMDQMNKHLQAIDWKMWVYLKANNYIS